MLKKVFVCLLCVLLLSLSVAPVFAAEEKEFTVKKEALLSALFEADIEELKTALKLGLVTSEELTEYYIGRIEKYNTEYNCFITLCEDATEVARQRDEALKQGKGKGMLFGIPVVIKDNIDLSGHLTTNGKAPSAARLAKSDSQVVKYLINEGAVIIGKTNMSTNALYATHSKSKAVGHTYNAYNSELSPGGSSGGSAVAVSLNFAAAGLGTDTGASLRYPAVINGCVSLRPTTGLISFEGITALDETRDTAGAITRSVKDQAIMLDVLTGGKHSYAENLRSDSLGGLRIGVIEELSSATDKTAGRGESKIDPEVTAAFDSAVKKLKSAGAEVVTVSFEDVFTLSEKTFRSAAQGYKDDLYEAFCSYLSENGLDAAIFPTYLSTPLYISDLEATYINNCKIISPSCGAPEIALTIGYHSSGAGIGMEIVSKKNSEQQLLNIAYSYVEKFSPRRSPKGAPDDYIYQNEGTLSDIFSAREEFLMQTEKEEAKEETSGQETKPDMTPYLVIVGLLVADAAVITLCILLIIWYKKQ